MHVVTPVNFLDHMSEQMMADRWPVLRRNDRHYPKLFLGISGTYNCCSGRQLFPGKQHFRLKCIGGNLMQHALVLPLHKSKDTATLSGMLTHLMYDGCSSTRLVEWENTSHSDFVSFHLQRSCVRCVLLRRSNIEKTLCCISDLAVSSRGQPLAGNTG